MEETMDDRELLLAVLDLGEVPKQLNTGVLEHLTPASAVLHLTVACYRGGEGERSRSAPADLRTLLNSLDFIGDKKVQLCWHCMRPQSGHTDPERRWTFTVRRLQLLEPSLSALDELERTADEDIVEYATKLVSAATAFSEENINVYAAHRLQTDWDGWYNDQLRNMRDRRWEDGKNRYEACVATHRVTRHLAQHRPHRANRLVAAEKGRGFLSGSTLQMSEAQDVLSYAGMLEGPKLGQTEEWFVTPATWEPGRSPTLETPKTLVLPAEVGPDAINAGLHLWDGGVGPALQALILSADHALSA
jgi:hypothetical protein